MIVNQKSILKFKLTKTYNTKQFEKRLVKFRTEPVYKGGGVDIITPSVSVSQYILVNNSNITIGYRIEDDIENGNIFFEGTIQPNGTYITQFFESSSDQYLLIGTSSQDIIINVGISGDIPFNSQNYLDDFEYFLSASQTDLINGLYGSNIFYITNP